MKKVCFLFAVILLLISCRQLPDFFKSRRKSLSPEPSIKGTYELMNYKGVDPSGRIHYPYSEKVKGIAIFNETEKFTIQFYDATRPRLSNADPFFCSDPEIRIAFLSEKSSYGHYQVVGDTVLLFFEGSNLPDLTGTVEKRYFKLQGDSLMFIGPARRHNGIILAEQSVWLRHELAIQHSKKSFWPNLKRRFSR